MIFKFIADFSNELHFKLCHVLTAKVFFFFCYKILSNRYYTDCLSRLCHNKCLYSFARGVMPWAWLSKSSDHCPVYTAYLSVFCNQEYWRCSFTLHDWSVTGGHTLKIFHQEKSSTSLSGFELRFVMKRHTTKLKGKDAVFVVQWFFFCLVRKQQRKEKYGRNKGLGYAAAWIIHCARTVGGK